MGLIISWIILSFVVGMIGSERRIGYWKTVAFSLALSPMVGFIVALLSKYTSEAKERMDFFDRDENAHYSVEGLRKRYEREQSAKPRSKTVFKR